MTGRLLHILKWVNEALPDPNTWNGAKQVRITLPKALATEVAGLDWFDPLVTQFEFIDFTHLHRARQKRDENGMRWDIEVGWVLQGASTVVFKHQRRIMLYNPATNAYEEGEP